MNTAFVVQGTLFFAGAVLVTRAIGRRGPSTFVGFAAANAVGNVVVATVPSGGAGTAWVHVAGAVVAIVGGNAAVLTGSPTVSAARRYRVASVGLGGLGLLGFAALAIGRPPRLRRCSCPVRCGSGPASTRSSAGRSSRRACSWASGTEPSYPRGA